MNPRLDIEPPFRTARIAVAAGMLLVLLLMATEWNGGLALWVIGRSGEQILYEWTARTYWHLWWERGSAELASFAWRIQGIGLLGYGLPLIGWLYVVYVMFRPLLRRGEVMVYERTTPYPRPASMPPLEVDAPSSSEGVAPMNLPAFVAAGSSLLPPSVPTTGTTRHLRPHTAIPVVAPVEEIDHEENGDVNLKQMAAVAVTVGALAACTPSKPTYRHNPELRERYEITIIIEDAPGPFTDIRGIMSYDVPDYSCVPETGSPMYARRSKPRTRIPYPLQQIAKNMYRAEVWADGIVDEDYYGLGVCKWEMMAATVVLKGKSVNFAPYLRLRELRAQQSKKLYFSKRTYASTTLENVPDSGEADRSRFGVEVRDELFTITLMPRRIDR